MSARRVVQPVRHGAWRIVDEIDEYEGDHEWAPRYEPVSGISEREYPTRQEASEAMT